MRHGKSGRQFGRNTSHRRAMLRALTANLVAHERIETTDAKAKELRRVAERLITRAIRLGDVAYTPHDKLSIADRARRQAAQQQVGSFLRRFQVTQDGTESTKVDLIEKVFVDLAKRFKSRPGGYTRIIKLGRRRGDNAPMSVIEFVDKGEPRAAAEPKAAAEKAPKAKKTEKAAAAGATADKPKAKKAVKAAAAG
jgi:large subunit ribosomal protein L17